MEWYDIGDEYPPMDTDEASPEGDLTVDPAVEEARDALLTFFEGRPEETFYERQLAVMFEDHFFHWVTVRALHRLFEEGRIQKEQLPLPPIALSFYHHKSNRYWVRKAKRIGELVSEFSDPLVTRGVGLQGETLFDAALPTVGFLPVARDVRQYKGTKWIISDENLDRIFERDGVAYGIEIKNTLPYIPREELSHKLAMCRYLGLKPLFIARMHPKSYMYDIIESGGYGLIFKYQLYPHGHADLAKRIRSTLGIPADSPRAIAAGTMQRLLNWHLQTKHVPPVPFGGP